MNSTETPAPDAPRPSRPAPPIARTINSTEAPASLSLARSLALPPDLKLLPAQGVEAFGEARRALECVLLIECVLCLLVGCKVFGKARRVLECVLLLECFLCLSVQGVKYLEKLEEY